MFLCLSRDILIFSVYLHEFRYGTLLLLELNDSGACLKVMQHLFSLHLLIAMTNEPVSLYTGELCYQKFLFPICMLVTIRYCPQVWVLEIEACSSKPIKSWYHFFSQQQRSSWADIVKQLWIYIFHYWHILESCGGDSHPWSFQISNLRPT